MSKLQRIRDPVHDLIEFNTDPFETKCWNLVKTPAFQRLRRIKQLGFSELTFPGATHSRLAHSLGVFNTARQLTAVVRRIKDSNSDSMGANTAVAAALVHDIGHGPFSHAFENAAAATGLGVDHEEWTVRIILETEIREILDEVAPGFAERVAGVIGADIPLDIYGSIVSSQFDADRLDYMRRDRLMSGSQHAAIDFTWLIANLEIGRVPVGLDQSYVRRAETFVLGPKSVMAGEAYVLGLFHLYPTVYLHKTTRGAEKIFMALLRAVFGAIRNGDVAVTCLPENHPIVQFAREPTKLENYLGLDDAVVLGSLPLLQQSKLEVISKLATRLHERKLYKCIDVTAEVSSWACTRVPNDGDLVERRKLISAKEALVRELVKERALTPLGEKEPDLLEDVAERNPYKDAKGDHEALKRIWVKGQDGVLHDLGHFSDVVHSLVPFRAYRLYYSGDSGKGTAMSLIKEVLQ